MKRTIVLCLLCASAAFVAGYALPHPSQRPPASAPANPAAAEDAAERLRRMHEEKMGRLYDVEWRRRRAEDAGDAKELRKVLDERDAIDREYVIRRERVLAGSE